MFEFFNVTKMITALAFGKNNNLWSITSGSVHDDDVRVEAFELIVLRCIDIIRRGIDETASAGNCLSRSSELYRGIRPEVMAPSDADVESTSCALYFSCMRRRRIRIVASFASLAGNKLSSIFLRTADTRR